MSQSKHSLRPHLIVALASSICAAANAGKPVEPALPVGPTYAQNDPAPKTGEPAAVSTDAPVTATPAPEAKPADGAAPADAAAKPTEQQSVPPPAAAPQPDLIGNQANGPSQTFAVNLLKLMVKKGHITKEEADELIREAEQDTAIARTQAQSDALTAAQAVVEQAKLDKVLPADPSPEDALRIPFIPEMVKKQIRDDLRQEVMAAAKSEHWNAPYQLPDWVSKFRVKGDIRLRYEGTYFSEGNDNTGAFPNFQAINTGAPFDVSGTVFSPQLNVDQDRQRYRIRLRLGAEVDMGDGFTAGVRIGTGQDSSPVSPNQSLGASGGNFSKYAIWLDRAFLKYEAGADPDRRIAITGGRGDNPFYSTDLIYDDDLGFDGLAIQGRYRIAKGVTPFATLGVFPIFNTDFNFSSNQPAKFDSTDKYLYGAQLGTDWKLTKHLTLKTAAAYYQFDGAEGEQSTPYTPLTSSDAGNTDNTRPSFAQKGNTYMPLRRIIPNASNNFGTSNQFQYFGLATKFQPLAFTARLDYNGFEPIQISLTGEYIKNLGFDRDRLNALGINNRAPISAKGTLGSYAGGDTAWMLGLRAGAAALQKRGDWQAGVYYKYIESDAVVDGFNDSDFGGGGTNAKGYGLWGTWAVSPRTAFGVRWTTATEIAGPPYSIDTLYVDFGGKF